MPLALFCQISLLTYEGRCLFRARRWLSYLHKMPSSCQSSPCSEMALEALSSPLHLSLPLRLFPVIIAAGRSGGSQLFQLWSLVELKLLKMNFDDVLVPADHVSRSYNDTYYVDSQTVLRCHTSAHQAELLRKGHTHFLVTGDVYRRDSIDATHYPVFHQMEGVRVFSPDDWEASGMDGTLYAAGDLKTCLEGLACHLFGAVEMRWVDTYFPFTNPSFELEIYFQDKWLEVLGCGVTEQEILKRSGKTNNVAWAFGLGLERLAMVLFDMPDIRLFWSTDERFTSQYPPCFKDVSFWISDSFTENNLCEIVRGVAGDLVEEVRLIDNFTNKKGLTSQCYRIAYRSMERSLTDDEINELQWNVRDQVQSKLNVVLR